MCCLWLALSQDRICRISLDRDLDNVERRECQWVTFGFPLLIELLLNNDSKEDAEVAMVALHEVVREAHVLQSKLGSRLLWCLQKALLAVPQFATSLFHALWLLSVARGPSLVWNLLFLFAADAIRTYTPSVSLAARIRCTDHVVAKRVVRVSIEKIVLLVKRKQSSH